MFLFVTQFLGESSYVSYRLLGIVFGHLELVAVIFQVSLHVTTSSRHMVYTSRYSLDLVVTLFAIILSNETRIRPKK